MKVVFMFDRGKLGRAFSSFGPFCFAYLVLCAIYLCWTWSHELGDFGGDNAFYLLTARYFSPWSGPDAVAAYFVSQSFYPPLYPLVLAIFGGGESLLAAHIITATEWLLAFAVFYMWLRKIGFARLNATLLVLLFALLPGTLMQALSILSECLYLLTTLGCLAAVAAYEADRREGWLWTAAFCITAAILTRSAGVTLMAAFVLYLVLYRPARFWVFILVSIVPAMLWQFLSNRTGPGYLSFFVAKFGADPLAGLIAHVTAAVDVLWRGWVIDFTSSPVGIAVMGFVGIVCLAGTAYRVYQRKLDGIYGAMYLALLFIWPYPAEVPRLLIVVVPILLAHGVALFECLPRLKVGNIALKPSGFLLVAIALIVAPSLILTIKRFVQPLPEDLAGLRHTSEWYVVDPHQALSNVVSDKLLTDHIKHLQTRVPEHDCIYSIKPSIVGYYSHRISVIPPRPELDDAAFAMYLEEKGCRFFFLMGFASPSYRSLFYPLERMRDSLKIVSVAELPGREGIPVSILAERSVK